MAAAGKADSILPQPVARVLDRMDRHHRLLKLKRAPRYMLRLRRDVKALRDGHAILIYTMGKVGTTSLFHALGAATDQQPVPVHTLTPARLDAMAAQLDRDGLRTKWLRVAQSKSRALHASEVHPPIITAVRDPGARAVSAFFEVLPRTRRFHENPNPSHEQLVAWFWNPEDVLAHPGHPYNDWSHSWFEDEFQVLTGLDVYSKRFNQKAGATQLAGNGYRALILKLEAGTEKWEQAVEEFLDVQLTLGKSNVGKDKRLGHMYRDFKANFTFPEEILDALYNSRYAKHFYTASERRGLRAQWEAS